MTDPLENYVKDFCVDFGAAAGTIRPLHGLNLGPWLYSGNLDGSEAFRRLRIPSVRVHDCGLAMHDVVDMHNVFPLMHADPADPRNYVFRPTDDYLLSIKNVGADIKYRLGESGENIPPSHPYRRSQFHDPPQDNEAWAEAALHLVMHYNDGWANGFHHGIKYWEVWNEPWAGGAGGFWSGTVESFFRFYETVAKKLKAYDPSLKVGAGLCGGDWNDFFSTPFLRLCKETNTPFDYHAWHQYTPHPAYVPRHARNVRSRMDGHGFAKAELHMDEWAPDFKSLGYFAANMPVQAPIQVPRIQGVEGASVVATTLCWLQDLPVDVANYYWAGHDFWGLWDHWCRPTKIYDAFAAFADLYNLGQRVQASGSEEVAGEGILAAMSEDKREAAILISRFEGWQVAVDLKLQGLPAGEAVAEFYELGDGRYPSPTRTEKITGPSVTLHHNIVAPEVVLLKLRFSK